MVLVEEWHGHAVPLLLQKSVKGGRAEQTAQQLAGAQSFSGLDHSPHSPLVFLLYHIKSPSVNTNAFFNQPTQQRQNQLF